MNTAVPQITLTKNLNLQQPQNLSFPLLTTLPTCYSVIPIEKLFSNRDSIRKAREAFSIQKGTTIDLGGLNIREKTY